MINISEINWGEQYPQLHAQARRLVNRMKIPNWLGQEEDVAWDIVQESMRKAFEYSQKAERGGEKPVQELGSLLYTAAQNCTFDLRRREKRLLRENTTVSQEFADTETNFSEIAIENVYREHLFHNLAHKIAGFPLKQREALLIDLANRMAFGAKPTTLQAAFQAEGIHLEEYQHRQPENEQDRNRKAVLLHQAYRRLKDLEDVKSSSSQSEAVQSQQNSMAAFLRGDEDHVRMMDKEPPRSSLETVPQGNALLLMVSFVERLPNPYRLPVRLHCFEKKSYAEIARQLCLPEGTIKSLISRGQKKLRELIEQDEVIQKHSDDNAHQKELVVLEEQIAKLPIAYQHPVRLHCILRKTYTEIADQLSIPKGTVKSYVSRGRKILASQTTEGV